MKHTLSQLQVFQVQSYMNENRPKLCGNTIADVKRTVQFALGFDVPSSRIIDIAKMFNMTFSKSMSNRKSTTEKSLNDLFCKIKSLAIAIDEIYEACEMKPRQEITELVECKRNKLR